MKNLLLIAVFTSFLSCKQVQNDEKLNQPVSKTQELTHARGFLIKKNKAGITTIEVNNPWPNAKSAFTYALVPKDKMHRLTIPAEKYDAVIPTPIEKIVVTSTTHIPALEALGVLNSLVGFPNTSFVSSTKARERIDSGSIQDLGNNEAINTEMTIALKPDVVIGFGINNQNKAYETLVRSKIPVAYNGDWTEETPLGKAEWIKFFAPFFGLEKKADRIFQDISKNYNQAKLLAAKAQHKPTVLTGGLYKDIWYVAGGKSWMAQFLKDSQTDYLWQHTNDTGSLSLSLESVLDKGRDAEFWLNPSMHTTYEAMIKTNEHYRQFNAFTQRNVFSNSINKGPTGGLLFYELAPQRPDLVLKDLIHIFHPALLPGHELYFFKPLK